MPSKEAARIAGPVAIGIGADENYALGVAVTIRSMLDHRRDPNRLFRIYVLDGGFTAPTRKRLLDSWKEPNVEVRFIKPDPKLYRNFPQFQYFGWTTYFRTLVADVVPEEDAIVYLDADLLVLKDVTELWEMPLGTNLAACALSSRSPWFASVPPLFTYTGLGFPHDALYYDVGVGLFHLALWRKEKVLEKIAAWIENWRDRLFLGEQDAMNALFYRRWLTLDQRWDTEFPTAEKDRILHFLGGQKPWKAGCPHPGAPLFFEYVDRTEWRGFRPPRTRRKPKRIEVLY